MTDEKPAPKSRAKARKAPAVQSSVLAAALQDAMSGSFLNAGTDSTAALLARMTAGTSAPAAPAPERDAPPAGASVPPFKRQAPAFPAQAQPQAAVLPEPAPDAEPQPEPEPVASVVAEPAPVPEPVAAPTPEPVAEPVAEPEPVHTLAVEPIAEPEPVVELEPVVEPTAEPEPEPEPVEAVLPPPAPRRAAPASVPAKPAVKPVATPKAAKAAKVVPVVEEDPSSHAALLESFLDARINSKGWETWGFRLLPDVKTRLGQRLTADKRSSQNRRLALGHYLNAALLELPEDSDEQIDMIRSFLRARGGITDPSQSSSYRVSPAVYDLARDLDTELTATEKRGLVVYLFSAAVEMFLERLDTEGPLGRPDVFAPIQ